MKKILHSLLTQAWHISLAVDICWANAMQTVWMIPNTNEASRMNAAVDPMAARGKSTPSTVPPTFAYVHRTHSNQTKSFETLIEYVHIYKSCNNSLIKGHQCKPIRTRVLFNVRARDYILLRGRMWATVRIRDSAAHNPRPRVFVFHFLVFM